MSDQTIRNSLGSKEQSAYTAWGHCEETEFLHFAFHHRKRMMRRDQAETREADTLAVKGAAVPSQGGCATPTGEGRLGSPASSTSPGDCASADNVGCELRTQSLGSSSHFGLFCELQYVHGWAFFLSKFREHMHRPLHMVNPNLRGSAEAAGGDAGRGMHIFFSSIYCISSLLCFELLSNYVP